MLRSVSDFFPKLVRFNSFLLYFCLKGQCHEIFDFWFFPWISFPQAPEYTIRAVSNFFENSWRYSQQVHHWCRWHQWQMEKNNHHKSFNYFVWTPLGSELTYRYILAIFKFTLRSPQPVIDNNNNLLFSFFATCINNTSESGGKICRRCWWHWCHRCHWYLDFWGSPRIFEKIQNGPNWILWGWGETDSWKKNRSKKSHDTVPLSIKY